MAGHDISSLIGVCVSSVYCLPTIVATALLAALIGRVVYQLYFHPLAKYPGPLLGRITQLYDVYHAYIGDKHVLLYDLHQRYGTCVRFSPNILSINDPAALRAIYSHGANVQKAEFYKCFRAAPTAISTLLATDKAHHARKRRIAGQAFSDSAIRDLEQYVQERVQELVDRISEVARPTGDEKRPWTSTLDMQKWCNWLVFDIMGELVFGRSFGTLGDQPENREGIRLLGRAARRNYTVAAMPALVHMGLEKYIPLLRGLWLDRNQYLAFGKRNVMARMKDHESMAGVTGRKDIFSFLLHARDPETGEGLPMPELWMEGNTLIVAGSDTSSTTLAATLHYLLHNPTAMARLREELDSTFTNAKAIRAGPQMQACTYLRACIDEAMRMTPAVPGLLPREVQAGGLRIPSLDLDLPAGTVVGVSTYAIQHHADFVAEPFVYDPARWFREPEREGLHAVFHPFSLGHRACLGKPLVYMELCIAVARLVWEFDMRVGGPEPTPRSSWADFLLRGRSPEGEYHIQDWFLSNNRGPLVQFKVRDHTGKDTSN